MCKVSIVAREIIKQKGLKQKYVAEQMKMTERKLSDILNGRKIIDEKIILSFCNALNVEPNELFGYDRTA